MSAPQILANCHILGLGNTTQLSPTNGVPPYAWNIMEQAGSSGGSIDSNGLYTAGVKQGVDLIQLSDANGAVDYLKMTVAHPLVLFCDILRTYLGLAPDQVYLYNQLYKVPPDQRLYIAVGVGMAKPISSRRVQSGPDDEFLDTQSVTLRQQLSLHILSLSTEALYRVPEVVLALDSNYARQQQAANGFYCAKLPGEIQNVSEIDGAQIPYHFYMSVNLQYAFEKQNSVPFFEEFEDPSIIVNP